MKLSDFVPDVKTKYGELNKIDRMVGFLDTIYKSNSTTNKMPSLGVDRWTNAWIQQRIGYRRQLLLDLWSLYLTTAEVRGPITVIRNEVFRRGLKWEPKFSKRCRGCGKEFEDIVEKCDECANTELDEPNEEQKERFDKFIEESNIFGQSLLEVLGGFEDNLNWADDAFIYLSKEYIEKDGKISARVQEIRNLHPGMMDLDLDDEGRPHKKHFTCYLHREVLETKKGKCKECKKDGRDRDLVPVTWIYYYQGTEAKYLLDEEIIHMTKFSHSETFGISPLITLYDKILALVGMDKTIYRYFFERKLPAGMLMVPTDDPDGLRRERDNMEARLKTDPDYMPIVAYSTKQGSRGRVDFVKLFHNILETDYLPIKNDIRDRIAAIWGVSPIWMSALEESGGISTQSVTGETPLYIRRDGKYLDIIPIGSLYKDHTDAWYKRVDQSIDVWTESGWSKIRGAYRHRNINEIRSIVSGDGIVNVTGEHSMKDDSGEWLNAREFEIGSKIRLNKIGHKKDLDTMNEEFAWALGLWCAEGFDHSSRTGVVWCNNNRSLLTRAEKAIRERYLKKTVIRKYRNNYRLTIYGKEIASDIDRMCLFEYDQKYGHGGKKKESFSMKKVPMEILNGSDNIKRAFLEGYYAGDGRQNTKVATEIKSVDSVLIAGIRYLYNSLGNTTSMHYDIPKRENHNPVYKLTVVKNPNIPGNEIKKIIENTDTGVWVYDIETDDNTFITALGDFVLHNSQQLVVTSRVVEADQKRINDKIFPYLLDAFNITDWIMVLEQPEEKAEATRHQFMQQKVMSAYQLTTMGFKVKIKPGIKSMLDIDFEVEEEPTNNMDQPGMMTPEYQEYMGDDQNGTESSLHAHDGIPPHPKSMNHGVGDKKIPQEEQNWKDYDVEPED